MFSFICWVTISNCLKIVLNSRTISLIHYVIFMFTTVLCRIYVVCFLIIIFIFNTINHIILSIQTNFFFGHVCHKFGLGVLLNFYLIFCQFQPGVTYKSVANKKKRVVHLKIPRKSTRSVLFSQLQDARLQLQWK